MVKPGKHPGKANKKTARQNTFLHSMTSSPALPFPRAKHSRTGATRHPDSGRSPLQSQTVLHCPGPTPIAEKKDRSCYNWGEQTMSGILCNQSLRGFCQDPLRHHFFKWPDTHFYNRTLTGKSLIGNLWVLPETSCITAPVPGKEDTLVHGNHKKSIKFDFKMQITPVSRDNIPSLYLTALFYGFVEK